MWNELAALETMTITADNAGEINYRVIAWRFLRAITLRMIRARNIPNYIPACALSLITLWRFVNFRKTSRPRLTRGRASGIMSRYN